MASDYTISSVGHDESRDVSARFPDMTWFSLDIGRDAARVFFVDTVESDAFCAALEGACAAYRERRAVEAVPMLARNLGAPAQPVSQDAAAQAYAMLDKALGAEAPEKGAWAALKAKHVAEGDAAWAEAMNEKLWETGEEAAGRG